MPKCKHCGERDERYVDMSGVDLDDKPTSDFWDCAGEFCNKRGLCAQCPKVHCSHCNDPFCADCADGMVKDRHTGKPVCLDCVLTIAELAGESVDPAAYCSGQALFDRLQGFYDKQKRGGGGFSSGERLSIITTIKGINSAVEKQYKALERKYQGLAKSYGFDPARALMPMDEATAGGAGSGDPLGIR